MEGKNYKTDYTEQDIGVKIRDIILFAKENPNFLKDKKTHKKMHTMLHEFYPGKGVREAFPLVQAIPSGDLIKIAKSWNDANNQKNIEVEQTNMDSLIENYKRFPDE